MSKIKKKITNPMTVIGIFAFISETSAAVSLPFLDEGEREVYIWFLISFPFYLLLLFFITLNFNYRSLYAPSDFQKDDSFLKVHESSRRAEDDLNSNTGKPLTAESDNKASSRSRSSCAVPTWIEHIVQLPKPLGMIRAIDVRQMTTRAAFENLMDSFPRFAKPAAKAIVFLTHSESEAFVRQIVPGLIKQLKKSGETTLVFAYDTDSQATTIFRGG
ncbi:hypothetical protein [Pseudomonas sp. HMWF021]|uniref:hypothetical protein n=1 Tax=Pseudomonas sp. HMWF021 TaxID=2056857 RepID=UPI000D3CCEF7|nr:hypothetical protein [Pseudomonas sp. HMWF021]PTT24367.1 hypothetical protein DBR18_27705 [Pseudomonas sp. HMWF021]